jgi:hypothetical protein
VAIADFAIRVLSHKLNLSIAKDMLRIHEKADSTVRQR